MALLKDLAARNATARTARDACVLATETLAARSEDITFALAYLDDELQSCTPAAPKNSWRSARRELVQDLPIFVVGCRSHDGTVDRWLESAAAVRRQLSGVSGSGGRPARHGRSSNARAYEEERQRAEALAEIDRAKTAFFSNVSHEFRTPLTLLLGPVQDALASPDRSLDADALAAVNRNALRLLKLVNTLLDFARIEAGRAEANYEPTDLARFTTDLAGAFRSAIESAGLQFEVECAPLDVPVDVDRSMWEKIVFNLLSNALKFTLRGTDSTDAGERSSDAVRLSVGDTGTGIAVRSVASRVRALPSRARRAARRTHEGTGIGSGTGAGDSSAFTAARSASTARTGVGTTFTVNVADQRHSARRQSRSARREWHCQRR